MATSDQARRPARLMASPPAYDAGDRRVQHVARSAWPGDRHARPHGHPPAWLRLDAQVRRPPTRAGRACSRAAAPRDAAASKPRPSSDTSATSASSRPVSRTRTLAGDRECFVAFCRASRLQKYTAVSTSRGTGRCRALRPPPGRGAVAAAASSAAATPARASTLGRCRARGRQRLDGRLGRGRLRGQQRGRALRARRPARVCASRRFTASATRCCWAPSWMSRSSRCRSTSCAVTSRSRTDVPPPPRRQLGRPLAPARHATGRPACTRPAWAARPSNSRTSTGVSGRPCSCRPAGRRAPLRPADDRHLAPHGTGAACGGEPLLSASMARSPRALSRSARSPRPAPSARRVPSASTSPCGRAAPRRRRSRSPSRRSCSARRTARAGSRCTHRPREALQPRICTGSKPKATTAVATIDRPTCGESVGRSARRRRAPR